MLNPLYIWNRRIPKSDMSDCRIEQPTSVKFGVQQAISGLAASIALLSQTDMVSDLLSTYENLVSFIWLEFVSLTKACFA